jgi:TPR repeat protein
MALGNLYGEGLGVVRSGVEAVKWYKKAANQGNANAMCCLGDMF